MFSDSDWTGDREARRSRSGGVALLAGCREELEQSTGDRGHVVCGECCAMVGKPSASRHMRRTGSGWCVFACAWTPLPREPWLPGAAWLFLCLQGVAIRKRLELKKEVWPTL